MENHKNCMETVCDKDLLYKYTAGWGCAVDRPCYLYSITFFASSGFGTVIIFYNSVVVMKYPMLRLSTKPRYNRIIKFKYPIYFSRGISIYFLVDMPMVFITYKLADR